jgi:hypothetical protein
MVELEGVSARVYRLKSHSRKQFSGGPEVCQAEPIVSIVE